MTSPKTLFSIFLILTMGLTQAASWRALGSNQTDHYFLDTESIAPVQDYPYMQAKVKMIVSRENTSNLTQKLNMNVGDYVEFLHWIDCQNNTWGIKLLIGYKKDGRPIPNGASRHPSNPPMVKANPKTVGKVIADVVCLNTW